MTTLRFVLILLLLLNALAFAAISGWLGFVPPRGEPERISNQLHPDRIKLLNPSAPAGGAPSTPAPSSPAPSSPVPSSPQSPEPSDTIDTPPSLPNEQQQAQVPPSMTPAPSPDTQCFYWSGLNASDADHLTALLTAGGMVPRQSSVAAPTSWWVRIPPQGSREAAERRVRELKAQGIADLYIVPDEGPNQFAISLGLFKTEASSNQHLAQLRAKGVRGASIAVRETVEYRLEVNAERAALESTIAGDPLAQRHAGCPP